jgi:hypothetical protein
MQFTISTLFLIFFNVAASLALFGPWGLLISVVALLSAFILNRCKKLKAGIGYVLILDEPWDSSYNNKLLNQILIEGFVCPSAINANNGLNYVAIIGPGTAWHKNGTVKLSDLPDGGSHTIMVVEVTDSDVHWAEPRDLTVEEVLEKIKAEQGLLISSDHPSYIQILFANGSVLSFPKDMSISLWEKILKGEFKVIDNIVEMEDEDGLIKVATRNFPHERNSEIWAIVLGTIIWLFSVVLLFHRAIKSRPKPAVAT